LADKACTEVGFATGEEDIDQVGYSPARGEQLAEGDFAGVFRKSCLTGLKPLIFRSRNRDLHKTLIAP